MIIVVSPHLDDAVFSCAGFMALAVRRGETVRVVTVFTVGVDHERRRAEDAAALDLLGVEHTHLGLLDAPERLGIARTHQALVEQSSVDPEDLQRVREALTSELASLPFSTRIYAPLGVGGHVDHLTVHAALRHRESAVFYEDRPYALVPGAAHARFVEAHLALVGADAFAAPHPAGPGAVEASLSELPHLGVFLSADPAERGRSLAWLEQRIRDPRPDPALPPREARLVVHEIDPEAAGLARRAAAAYSCGGALLPTALPSVERMYHPTLPGSSR